jgi:hypothetical protein
MGSRVEDRLIDRVQSPSADQYSSKSIVACSRKSILWSPDCYRFRRIEIQTIMRMTALSRVPDGLAHQSHSTSVRTRTNLYTRLVHKEEFSGMLFTPLMRWMGMDKKTTRGFEAFNAAKFVRRRSSPTPSSGLRRSLTGY